MVTQFVNSGTDLEVLNKSYESMPLEQQEELSKALKRDGLVQKQITVQGKHGTYTKMAWVKAGDDNPAPNPTKQQAVPQDDKPTHTKSSASSKETKAAVSDLRKQHGADKVMAAAKAAGITWKENGNEGINWMRCAMAMAASSDKLQAVNDNLSGKANDTSQKNTADKATSDSTPAKSGSGSDFSTPRDAKGKPEKMPKDASTEELVKYTAGSANGEYSKKLTEAAGFDPDNTKVFVKEDSNGNKTFIVDNGQSRPDEISGKEMAALIDKNASKGKGKKAQKFTRKLNKRIAGEVSKSTQNTVAGLADKFNQLKELPLDKNSDVYKKQYEDYKSYMSNYPPEKIHEQVVWTIQKHNTAVKNLKQLAKYMKDTEVNTSDSSSGTNIEVKFNGITVGQARKMFRKDNPFSSLISGSDNGLSQGGSDDQFGIANSLDVPGVGVSSHLNSEYQADDNEPLTLIVQASNYSDSDMGGVGNHDLYWDSSAKEWKQ